MKEFLQKYLSWILVVILIIILIFFRSCNCGPGTGSEEQKKNEEKEKPKPTGNPKFDSLKVKEILNVSKREAESIKFPSKINLNAVNGYKAGVRCVAGDKGEVWVTPNDGLDWVQGKGTGNENLYGTAVLSYKTMIAVGNKGTIIRSIDAGLNWVSIKSGTNKNIKSVSFADNNIGYAVGETGLVLKTEDAGLTWSDKSVPQPVQINSVCFINPNTGWFAGKGGIIYKTINAGALWTPLDSLHKPTSANLNGISFSSLTKGTAVGESGTILNTTDGGSNWTLKTYSPAKNLIGVHRVSNILAYIVGEGIIIRDNSGAYTTITPDGSKTYNAVDPESPYISAISVGNTGTIYCVNTTQCDDCTLNLKGNHDIVFFPPNVNDNARWKVRLRIYNDAAYDFKRLLKFITPGMHMDHTVLSGWTQYDNSNTQYYLNQDMPNNNPRLQYTRITGTTDEGYDDIDFAILNMAERQAGYIEIALTPIASNTFNNGKVEFYFGRIDGEGTPNEDTTYCYKITYILGE